ncbi:hypothetical protein M427DRAFT_39123 [Gonapodya prolifera JEL478]|uniref:Uncharacterized protein n=1 Tax=Gonapodya prolifera (strain JEL478) TaxID=1344416 RepID=A0A138ZXW2_GONPJ|nr:hypothetical protein M427DRAFT_39123 [Gonapodya prolifera JEL478]|eukprot:KXS09347.1 hypothetical protein M427DRAFT_39123 [Gonapodya prolifera JEL478]
MATTVTQMTRCATLVTSAICMVHNQLMITNKTKTILSWSGRLIAPGYFLTFVLMFGYTYMDASTTGAQATYAIARCFNWLTQSLEAVLLASFGDILVVGMRGIVEKVNWTTATLIVVTGFIREIILCYQNMAQYFVKDVTVFPANLTSGLQGLLAGLLLIQVFCHMARIHITHSSNVSKFVRAYVNSRASKVAVLMFVRCLSWFLLLIPALGGLSGITRAWGDNLTIFVGTVMAIIMLEKGNAESKGTSQNAPTSTTPSGKGALMGSTLKQKFSATSTKDAATTVDSSQQHMNADLIVPFPSSNV